MLVLRHADRKLIEAGREQSRGDGFGQQLDKVIVIEQRMQRGQTIRGKCPFEGLDAFPVGSFQVELAVLLDDDAIGVGAFETCHAENEGGGGVEGSLLARCGNNQQKKGEAYEDGTFDHKLRLCHSAPAG